MFKGGLEIYADGGCRRNGAEDAEAYGSFLIRALRQNRVIAENHSGILDYPDLNTNNDAELWTFIKAMRHPGWVARFRHGAETPYPPPAAGVPPCSHGTKTYDGSQFHQPFARHRAGKNCASIAGSNAAVISYLVFRQSGVISPRNGENQVRSFSVDLACVTDKVKGVEGSDTLLGWADKLCPLNDPSVATSYWVVKQVLSPIAASYLTGPR
jgi:hypothetical protein